MRVPASAIVGIIAIALAGVLFPLGWFQPLEFPDTATYVDAAQKANPWGEPRHPLYGWLLSAVDALGPGRSAVPALQFGFQALGAMVLASGLRLAGGDHRAAIAIGAAAILGQSVVIWGRGLIPESLAVSLLTMALGLTLSSTRGAWFWPAAALAGLATVFAVLLRPIMLPAVLLLPALYIILCAMQRQGWQALRAAAFLAFAVVPLVGQAAQRQNAVGDFNIVSFGGFASLGMSAQILSPELVPQLPEALRPLAQDVLAARQRAVDAQAAMPLFRNSTGERSFRVTALDGFDTLARNFDEIVIGEITKLRRPGEPWVAFNARMGALTPAVLRAAPERYLFWMAGATSRLVGRVFAYNVAFMLALLAFASVALWNLMRSGRALGGTIGDSWSLIVLVSGVWVVATSALSVVAAFPALRYTDTGGLLLTALPLYGLLLALSRPAR